MRPDRSVRVVLVLSLLLGPWGPAAWADGRLTESISSDRKKGEDVLRYVDLTIGSEGWGNVVIGPSLPFGMAKPSPDCSNRHASGWMPLPEPVDGFAQIHLSGTGGGPKYGNVLLQPFSDSMEERKHVQHRRSENIELGRYACTYEESGITTELTVSRRTSLYRFTYPENGVHGLAVDAGFFLSLDEDWAVNERQEFVGSEIQVLSDREVSGYTRIRGGWNDGRAYTVYFHVTADHPFTLARTWKGDTISEDLWQEDSGEQTGALLQFSPEVQTVQVKVGLSWLGCLKARKNALAEIPHWSFDTTREELEDSWRAILSRAELDASTPDSLKRMFYTGLYHAFLLPVDKTGENPVWNDGEPYYEDFYALWDTFRTTTPMMMLLLPERGSEFVRSLLSIYRHDKYLPDGRSGHWNGRTQGGSNADIVIADAWLKGLSGIDWDLALEAVLQDADVPPGGNQESEGRGGLMEYNTLGFLPYGVPRAGSRIVEYSRCDYAIYQLAKGLGRDDLAERFLRQSGNWKNMWRSDYEHDGSRGFIMPRNRDGSWPDRVPGLTPPYTEFPFTPVTYEGWTYSSNWDCFFYEGNSWIYSLCIPHDVPGLIEACGGPEAFRRRLDTFFQHPYFEVSNEPSFFAPCLYHWLGRPDLTGEVVRETILGHFSDRAEGLPGNDDSGATSCWLDFHLMGLYPVAGQDLYILHAPLLPGVTLHLDGGDFRIRTRGQSERNRFVRAVRLNGKDYPYSALRHRDIAGGGELVFIMGPEPGPWGKEILPPAQEH